MEVVPIAKRSANIRIFIRIESSARKALAVPSYAGWQNEPSGALLPEFERHSMKRGRNALIELAVALVVCPPLAESAARQHLAEFEKYRRRVA